MKNNEKQCLRVAELSAGQSLFDAMFAKKILF